METFKRILIATQLALAVIYTLPAFSPQLSKDSDFVSFYTAWSMIRHGEASRLYDLDLQADYQAKLFGPEGAPFRYRVLPFINPPHAALFFTPLGYLSLDAAANVFLILNGFVLIWVLRRFWQLATDWPSTSRVLMITTIVGSEVLWYGLVTRTLSLITLAVIIEYYLALKHKENCKAAVWLSLATIKPQLVLMPALIPLATRRWRLLAITIGIALITGMALSLFFGFEIWSSYFRALREVSSHGDEYGASVLLMNNLRMVLSRIFPSAVTLAIAYVALIFGIFAAFRLWSTVHNFEIGFAITVLLGLLLVPHLNYQDTLLAFLPGVLTYGRIRHRKSLIKLLGLCVLVATAAPPMLIFSGKLTLRATWPLPLMVILLIICLCAFVGPHFNQEHHQ